MDYPRPPRVERRDRLVRIEFGGSRRRDAARPEPRCWRRRARRSLLLPPDDVRQELLEPIDRRGTSCRVEGGDARLRPASAIAARRAQRGRYIPRRSPGSRRSAATSSSTRAVSIAPPLRARVTPQPGGFYGALGWYRTTGPSDPSRAGRAPRAGDRRRDRRGSACMSRADATTAFAHRYGEWWEGG